MHHCFNKHRIRAGNNAQTRSAAERLGPSQTHPLRRASNRRTRGELSALLARRFASRETASLAGHVTGDARGTTTSLPILAQPWQGSSGTSNRALERPAAAQERIATLAETKTPHVVGAAPLAPAPQSTATRGSSWRNG